MYKPETRWHRAGVVNGSTPTRKEIVAICSQVISENPPGVGFFCFVSKCDVIMHILLYTTLLLLFIVCVHIHTHVLHNISANL